MSQFSKPLARKPYSSNPADSHLEVVLHQNFKGEYCTHVLNEQTGGFVHGHYFGKDSNGLSEALQDFNSRGVETKLNEVDKTDSDSKELLETVRLLTFALETATTLGAVGLGPVVRDELANYVSMGKETLKKHGIEG